MARLDQNIDPVGPDALLSRSMHLAREGKLNEAILWAATVAQRIGGAAFFDSNALAGALLVQAGYPDEALHYWDRIIRSAPHKLEWLEKAVRIYLQHNTEKSREAVQNWLGLFSNIYISAPSLSFMELLEQHGLAIPGSVGIHAGKLKGWVWTRREVVPTLETSLGNKFPVKLQPTGHNGTHVLYTIDESLPASDSIWRIAIGVGEHALKGSPVVCSHPNLIKSVRSHVPGKVTIIVPVYDDAKATLQTIGTLLASLKFNQTRPEILVAWDQGPDARLLQKLGKMAKKGKFTLRINPANLGFLGSVNEALASVKTSDVILLNADTIVHGNWIDRLCAAGAMPDAATVTVLSNEAELMSYPSAQDRGKVNTLKQTAVLDNAAGKLEPAKALVEIPVGVGFCMLITRRALNQIGGLDGYHVCRGYGEESDFCLRASAKGLKNYGVFNIFVAHIGERSFGTAKRALAAQNNEAIFERFPDYQKEYALALHDERIKSLKKKIAINTLTELTPFRVLEIRPWHDRLLPPWIKDEKHKPERRGCAMFVQGGKRPRALLRIWAELPIMEMEFDLSSEIDEFSTALNFLQYDSLRFYKLGTASRNLVKQLGFENDGMDATSYGGQLPVWAGKEESALAAPPGSLAEFGRLCHIARGFPDKKFFTFHIETLWPDVRRPANIFEIPMMADYRTLGPECFIFAENPVDYEAWQEWLASHDCGDLPFYQLGSSND